MTKSATRKKPFKLRTEAWLLRGISSIPGELALAAETLSFTALNTGSAWPWQLRKLEREVTATGIAQTIDQGERTLVFSWPTHEIHAWCPWYYFGGGIKVKRQQSVLRFSFGKPANMRAGIDRLDPIATSQQVSGSIDQVHAMRSVGAQWLHELSQSRGEAGS